MEQSVKTFTVGLKPDYRCTNLTLSSDVRHINQDIKGNKAKINTTF